MIVTDRDLEHFFIEHDALDKYNQYESFKRNHKRPFFDVFLFATSIGIGFKDAPLDANLVEKVGEEKFYAMVSGMLIGNEVWINPNHHPFRQRFTLAHEIGHYLSSNEKLIIDLNTYFRSTGKDVKKVYSKEELDIEKKMDSFATALLVSEEYLRRYYLEVNSYYKDMEKVIDSLSKLFSISKQSLLWRIADLGL